MNKKIFLGGTCTSNWRDDFISFCNHEKIPYFNPVVKNWTPDCIEIENQEKESSDIRIYVITPKMEGHYSIAEAVHDAIKYPEKTILCVLAFDGGSVWSTSQTNSWRAIMELVRRQGAETFSNVMDFYQYLRLNKEKIIE